MIKVDETKSILKDVRVAVGVSEDVPDFDTDLMMYINAALGTLNQNGVGLPVVVFDETITWGEFKNPSQVLGNLYYHMVPSFVLLSVKMIFDPPPPSAVEFMSNTISQLLWRLKVAYEEPTTTTTTVLEVYE